MTEDSPEITIGMPVRNGEHTIGPTIQSLIHQSYTKWKLLVCDDGSTDQTETVVKAFGDQRVHFYKDSTSKGTAFRRSQCLELAESKYFAFLDADDLAFPKRLEHQLEYIRKHPDLHIIGCKTLTFDHESYQILKVFSVPETHEAICQHQHHSFPLTTSSLLGLTHAFKDIGYRSFYKPNHYSSFSYNGIIGQRMEDLDFLLRASRKYRLGCDPNIDIAYRVIPKSLKKDWIYRKALLLAIYDMFQSTGEWQYARGMIISILKMCYSLPLTALGKENIAPARYSHKDMESVQSKWAQLLDRLNLSAPNP